MRKPIRLHKPKP